MTRNMRDAVRFFRGAGGITSALHLARAEAHAKAQGWTFEWVDDETASLDDAEDHDVWCREARRFKHEGIRGYHCDHEILGCILKGPDGGQLASLWGIIDPDRDYGRTIEAELASEALAEEEARTAADAGAASYMAL